MEVLTNTSSVVGISNGPTHNGNHIINNTNNNHNSNDNNNYYNTREESDEDIIDIGGSEVLLLPIKKEKEELWGPKRLLQQLKQEQQQEQQYSHQLHNNDSNSNGSDRGTKRKYEIPNGVETPSKIRAVLEKEFDVEIELRNEELRVIEQRLNQTMELLKTLQNLIPNHVDTEETRYCLSFYGKVGSSLFSQKSESQPKNLRQPHHAQEKNANNTSKHKGIEEDGGTPKQKWKHDEVDGRTIRIRAGADKLYARLADGTFVQFVCPTCKRDKFINKLGFVNHCRILHKLKFATYEDASVHCGVPVDESEVPADDPCRREQSLSFFQKNGIFHSQRQITHPYNSISSSYINNYGMAGNPSGLLTVENNGDLPQNHSLNTSGNGNYIGGGDAVSVSNSGSNGAPYSYTPTDSQVSNNSSNSNHDKHGSINNNNNVSNNHLGRSKEGGKSVPTRSTQTPQSGIQKQALHIQATPSAEHSSRFYVKKRIIVGNTSKSIPAVQRESDDKATHKWMIYVRGPAEEPDISYFVRKVWFYLHASFQPNDLVEVFEPPFQLTRRGWGEFPVRVRLFFVDPKNKPIDIIHNLKLDTSFSGLQILGGETSVDVELDRFFFENRTIEREGLPTLKLESMSAEDMPLEPLAVVLPENIENYHPFDIVIKDEPLDITVELHDNSTQLPMSTTSSSDPLNITSQSLPPPPAPTPAPTSSPYVYIPSPHALPVNPAFQVKKYLLSPNRQGVEAPFRLIDCRAPAAFLLTSPQVESCLLKALKLYPIISEHTSVTRLLTYGCATSRNVYFQWPLGKQKSSEWQRARQLRKYLRDNLSVDYPTKQIVYWCREKSFTPLTPAQNALFRKSLQTTNDVEQEPHTNVQSSSKKNTPTTANTGATTLTALNNSNDVEVAYFCKYCGSAHAPAALFDQRQRQCSSAINLNTYTPISDLFPSLKLPIMPKSELASTLPPPTSTPTAVNAITKLPATPNGTLPPAIAAKLPPPIHNTTTTAHNNASAANTNSKKPASSPLPQETETAEQQGQKAWIRSLLKQISVETAPDRIPGKHCAESAILTAAMNFTQAIIQETYTVYSKQRSRENLVDARIKVMTPVHVFSALKQKPIFDFLTNFGLGTEKDIMSLPK